MKKQIFLSALVLIGFTALTSCKKNKDNDDAVNPTVQGCVLDRQVSNSDSIQLSYDSDNRVTKIQAFNTTGNSLGYSLNTYSLNKIVQVNYNDNGDITSKINFILNGNNNAAYSVYGENGNFDSPDTTWYTYDSNKHNTRRVTKNFSTLFGFDVVKYDTTWYTYTGDNLTKKEMKPDNGSLETTIYSYGNMNAKSKFLAPEASIIKNLYGTLSAKLPTSKTEGSTTVTYAYTLNSENFVSRMITMESGTTESDVYFRYNCK